MIVLANLVNVNGTFKWVQNNKITEFYSLASKPNKTKNDCLAIVNLCNEINNGVNVNTLMHPTLARLYYANTISSTGRQAPLHIEFSTEMPYGEVVLPTLKWAQLYNGQPDAIGVANNITLFSDEFELSLEYYTIDGYTGESAAEPAYMISYTPIGYFDGQVDHTSSMYIGRFNLSGTVCQFYISSWSLNEYGELEIAFQSNTGTAETETTRSVIPCVLECKVEESGSLEDAMSTAIIPLINDATSEIISNAGKFFVSR